jgi:hypothetical protein
MRRDNLSLRQFFNYTGCALFAIATSVALLSCSVSSGENSEAANCGITLLPTNEAEPNDSQKKISYSGTLPENCVKQTTERNGRTLVKLSTQSSEPSELVALEELKAGQRSLKFDTSSDNLRRGSFEKSFDSTLLPDWSVPWADKPTTITLSMLVAGSASAASVPKSVSVELKF